MSGEGEMTLAFGLAALEAFADPAAVFADARRWSRHVGVVDDDADAVAARIAAHDLQQDYDLGERDRWLAMAEIREATDTDRHVFVGRGLDDRRLAEQVGWEFVGVDEAAAKAGWELESDSERGNGILARLQGFLSGGSP